MSTDFNNSFKFTLSDELQKKQGTFQSGKIGVDGRKGVGWATL